MYAALVTDFARPPRYSEVNEPEGDDVVELVAAALHPRVRSQASGSHYTSTDELPLIPGIDGVGRRADGSLVYFLLPDTQFGSMSERVAIDPRRSIPMPAGASALTVAAAMNPAMSSWLALRRRAHLEPGQSVLVVGATGSAGQLAIQVARHLGAGTVIAAGRDTDALRRLGADGTMLLDEVSPVAANVDIVIDYLWGGPAERLMPRLLTAREDRSAPLTWVQVGAVAGPEIALPSALLRAANIAIMGSGQGSIATRTILEELVPLMDALPALALDTDVRSLSDVETVWTENSRKRVVFTTS